MTVRRDRRRGFPAALALLAVTAALAGCGRAGSPVWIAAPAGGQVASGSAGGTTLPTANPTGDDTGPPPARIRIPDIGVDAPLEQLHLLADGSLGAPSAWGDAGWYADGTRPGDIGPAIIAGHIDSTKGPAVFYKLDKLRAGSLVEVLEGDRWLAFTVTSVARYPKNAFPTATVYGPTPDAALRLITCGGVFDRAHDSYLDNTVVYAVAA
jgi:hypothetical protein